MIYVKEAFIKLINIWNWIVNKQKTLNFETYVIQQSFETTAQELTYY